MIDLSVLLFFLIAQVAAFFVMILISEIIEKLLDKWDEEKMKNKKEKPTFRQELNALAASLDLMLVDGNGYLLKENGVKSKNVADKSEEKVIFLESLPAVFHYLKQVKLEQEK